MMLLKNVYRAQWKAFRRYTASTPNDESTRPRTYPAQSGRRLYVCFGPITIGVCIFVFRIEVSGDTVNALLAVLGIIAGTLLAAFSQLAAWRQTLGEHNPGDLAHKPDRWLVNAAVAHVSAAAASAVLACILFTLSLFISPNVSQVWSNIHQALLACGVAFTAHTLITVLIVISNLYSVYVQMNRIDSEQDGNDFTN